MRSKIQPGLALAAGVLVAAVLAFVLLGRGGGEGASPLPAPGLGSAVQLLPRGGAHTGAGQHDASVAQYGSGHRGGRLIERPRRRR